VTSPQGPSDDGQCIVHVVRSAHGLTGRSGRLLKQTQHVRRGGCIPLHTLNTPVLWRELILLDIFILNISVPNRKFKQTNKQSLSAKLNTHTLREYV